MPQPGASLPSYRASIPLSNHTLIRLAELIRRQRAERRCRWRKLDPAQQALLVLAHLRNGDTYARLAAGFAIGTTTAWRYIRESVDLLAALADDVHAAVHDLTAARTVGLIDALTGIGVKTFADKGYQGAGGTIRTPFKRYRHRPLLSRGQLDVNRAHARIRAIGERAVATLKSWKVLTKLRCCPHRATALVRAILVLQLVEEGRYSG